MRSNTSHLEPRPLVKGVRVKHTWSGQPWCCTIARASRVDRAGRSSARFSVCAPPPPRPRHRRSTPTVVRPDQCCRAPARARAMDARKNATLEWQLCRGRVTVRCRRARAVSHFCGSDEGAGQVAALRRQEARARTPCWLTRVSRHLFVGLCRFLAHYAWNCKFYRMLYPPYELDASGKFPPKLSTATMPLYKANQPL